MSKLQNESFKKFLKSFNGGEYNNHKFYDTITEISRKESGDRSPLISNKKEMYSLDDIAKGSVLLKDNLPKTTDALWYKEEDDGKFSIYLIEFKFHNLDNPDAKDQLNAFVDNIYAERKKYKCISEDEKYELNKIKKYYGDNVNHSLILKPIETLNVVIPKLYDEYCDNNPDDEKINIKEYLNTIEKKYYVFVSTYTENGKFNPQNERLESQGTKLEQHFNRLVSGEIIDYYGIWPRCDFDDFLKLEQLI